MSDDFDITVARAELAELNAARDAGLAVSRRALNLAEELLAERDRLAAHVELLGDKPARTALDAIVMNARADAERAYRMYDEASAQVDRLRAALADERARHASTRRALERALEGTVR